MLPAAWSGDRLIGRRLAEIIPLDGPGLFQIEKERRKGRPWHPASPGWMRLVAGRHASGAAP